MLILVGVTINVAMNGGLFNTANEASTGTEEKTIYDQIVGAMVLTNEGKINVKDTFDKVVEIFGTSKVSPNTISDGATEIQFEVTGKKGRYKYKITGSEIKENPEESGSGEVKGFIYSNKTFRLKENIDESTVMDAYSSRR